jgi:hypothetical protein
MIMSASNTVIDLNVVMHGEVSNDRSHLSTSTMGALLSLIQTLSKAKQTKIRHGKLDGALAGAFPTIVLGCGCE